jgi:hypothetical protein
VRVLTGHRLDGNSQDRAHRLPSRALRVLGGAGGGARSDARELDPGRVVRDDTKSERWHHTAAFATGWTAADEAFGTTGTCAG